MFRFPTTESDSAMFIQMNETSNKVNNTFLNFLKCGTVATSFSFIFFFYSKSLFLFSAPH